MFHPVRGGTGRKAARRRLCDISIHPPREGRDQYGIPQRHEQEHFNPPTPCGVGRPVRRSWLWPGAFQSTHPVRGGTPLPLVSQPQAHISIHPPRAGWDLPTVFSPLIEENFNPPTPCGVGPPSSVSLSMSWVFQSTHPVWGGTAGRSRTRSRTRNFNPPTPCGVGPSPERLAPTYA